jgi:hypothetical protein
MVLERRSDREFVIYFPNCDGEDGDLARRAGATVEKQTMVTECQFSSRASLERAVRGLKLAGAMRLVRISRR